MSFVLYDVETTGTRKAYDQILQFAALRTDFELQEIGAFDTCARLSPHIVPSPNALHINRLDIQTILDASRPSLYRMVCNIREQLERWTPATFLGFNSISFDEEVLRQAFYQCLFPPYLTNTPPNTRGDVLHLMRAFAAFHPDDITVPTSDTGKRTFALRPLALANDFPDFDAHEAMADVRAMLHLCRLVAERAPDLWSRYQQFTQKRTVVEFIREEIAFLHFDASWNSGVYCVTRLGEHPEQTNIQYCLSLTADIDTLAVLDPDALTQYLSRNGNVILRLKTNGAPVLCPIDDAPAHLMDDQVKAACSTLAEKVRADKALTDRLCAASIANERSYAPSPHVESQLYEQPFWPGTDEQKLLQFHQKPWEQRRTVIDSLSDKRSWRLARRLMYMERPDLLLENERKSLAQSLYNRISDNGDQVPWLTIRAAQRELDALLAELGPQSHALLERYQVYLLGLNNEETGYCDGAASQP